MDGMQEFLSRIGEGLRSLAGSIAALGEQIEAYVKKQAEAPEAEKPKAREAKTVKKAEAAAQEPGPAKKKPAAPAKNGINLFEGSRSVDYQPSQSSRNGKDIQRTPGDGSNRRVRFRGGDHASRDRLPGSGQQPLAEYKGESVMGLDL